MSKIWQILSLKNKIVVVILAAILFVTIPLCIFVVYRTYQKEQYLFETQMEVISNLTMKNLIAPLNFDDKEGAKEILDNLNDYDFINFSFVILNDIESTFIFSGNIKFKYKKIDTSIIKEIKLANKNNLFLKNYGDLYTKKTILIDNNKLGTLWVVANNDFIISDIKYFILIIFFVEILILVIAYLFSVKIQILISSPIIRLTEKMNKIALSKDFTIQIDYPKESKDEIGLLYSNFNLMLAQILEYQNKREEIANELFRLNLELEIKVKERTEDLLFTNNELRDEIEKKNIIETELENINNTKDKLLNILAHDLKNPLIALKYRFERNIVQLQKNLIREVEDSNKDIYHNIEGLINMIDELLLWSNSYSKNIEFNPENINLSELIEKIKNILHTSAKNKSIAIELEISKELYIYADKFMIETALRNLISNSIKYTRYIGYIKIKAQKFEDIIEIIITDNGVGMSEEELKNIFSLEKRKSKKGTNDETGTGLGMLISQDLINKNSGSLWVESMLGKGTTFTILLVEGNSK